MASSRSGVSGPRQRALLALLLAGMAAVCRGQVKVVPLPGIGGGHKGRWYVWLIVALAGVTGLYVLFFVVRGFLVARRRRLAFREAGISETDRVYGARHETILQRLLPRHKVPQGKVDANLSPMLSQLQATGLSVYKQQDGMEEGVDQVPPKAAV